MFLDTLKRLLVGFSLLLIIIVPRATASAFSVTSLLDASITEPKAFVPPPRLKPVQPDLEQASILQARLAALQARQADLDTTANRMQPAWTLPNNYAPFNCTAYVASRIPVPNSLGNADMWGYGLIVSGWRTGDPRRGAVGVSTAGWAGHVAIDEHNNPDGSVHISEYNYIPYSYSERDVAATDFQWYYQ